MDEIVQEVIDTLQKRHYLITTAESCTGGMIASTIVDIAGVSEIFHQGYVTYSNQAKCDLLGVDMNIIEQYGVVSEETVIAMAKGAAKDANAQVSLATTGVAGPDGGTKEHPVGEVWIGCYINGVVYTTRILSQGNRTEVRKEATKQAFLLLKEKLV